MKVAIMQPYFFPYIGYFQLINSVDEFVVYDNIEFAKKGWINRNRILVNGTDSYITLPLKKDSDYSDVRDRFLADSWPAERKKMLNRITESYRKAPFFAAAYPLVEQCILVQETNLFRFILNSLTAVKEYLEIQTPFLVSSAIPVNHELRAGKKVIEICKARNATMYLNPVGGVELYEKEEFKREGIDLHFIKSGNIVYKQFDHAFVPWLSIIDLMMFNSREDIKKYLNSSYTIE